MKKVELSRRDLRIGGKFSGGKTYGQVCDMTKEPGPRQIRRSMRRLMDAGYLEDLMRGQYGPKPHLYIPTSDSFGPVRPRGKKIEVQERDENEILASIYEAAEDAVTAIKASSRSRKASRVRDICNQRIKPIIQDIYVLRETAHLNSYLTGPFKEIVLPGEYFTGECDSYLRGPFGWKRRLKTLGRKGTIRVRHPSSSSEDDWFYPSLEEWEDYLGFLAIDLSDHYLGHLMKQLRGSS